MATKNSDLEKQVAILLGCTPVYSEHYDDWCCSCDNQAHGIDQQCSLIADYANPRGSRFREVVTEMKRRGLKLPPIDTSPEELCRLLLLHGPAPKRVRVYLHAGKEYMHEMEERHGLPQDRLGVLYEVALDIDASTGAIVAVNGKELS